jgi:hypothetical protein
MEEAYKDLDATGLDAYRDCVKSILFLNLGISLNTRVLDLYHGVKNGQFWDFHDYHNPVPLDLTNLNLKLFDCSTLPAPSVAATD